jgi:hypothetical protein
VVGVDAPWSSLVETAPGQKTVTATWRLTASLENSMGPNRNEEATTIPHAIANRITQVTSRAPPDTLVRLKFHLAPPNLDN